MRTASAFVAFRALHAPLGTTHLLVAFLVKTEAVKTFRTALLDSWNFLPRTILATSGTLMLVPQFAM
eukprot:3880285-Amphidinium_carterae.1